MPDKAALLNAITILEAAQVAMCSDPGPGWTIVEHARQRLMHELCAWPTGHELNHGVPFPLPWVLRVLPPAGAHRLRRILYFLAPG